MRLFYVIAAILILWPATSFAEYAQPQEEARELSMADRMALARQFVAKISKGFAAADKSMKGDASQDLSNLEGEQLLFRIRLERKLTLEAPILTSVENGELLMSLRDLVSALEFPIDVDPEKGTAQGWYVRENKTFALDMGMREVQTAHGAFKLSDKVRLEDGDIIAPIGEINQWFGFTLKPNASTLDIKLDAPYPLPVQEKIARGKRDFNNKKIGPPVLPPADDQQKAIDFPFVDVTTSTNYRRPGDGEKNSLRQTASVRTTGDVAFGTLTTQSQYDREENLTNARMTYKKESTEKELLGPLKARKFEVGDVVPVPIPLNKNSVLGIGARVTNADPLRGTTRPSTEIRGSAFPGWDVELYRENQLLGFKQADDSGQYVFENVDLFANDNNFRVVLYGPQGEIREEEINIPVDPKRLANAGMSYDVMVAAQDTQTYRKVDIDDKDQGAPAITALIEKPFGESSAATAGLTTRQDNGNMKATGYGGISTTMMGTLFNLNTAMDQEGEMAAELVARRNLSGHEFRNETFWATDKFGDREADDPENGLFTAVTEPDNEVLGNEFSVNGPLGLNLGLNSRYSVGLDFAQSAEGNNTFTSTAGINTVIRPVSIGQQFQHTMSDIEEEDTLNSITNINGTLGRNRLRLTANYEIKPESQLERVAATLKRRLTPKTELDLGLQRTMETKLTEASARVNWDAGFAQITPGVTYNTDRDITATLNTRFGIARDPQSGSIRMFDRAITSNGGVSAFVFLDKDGDNVFSEGDEPIPDAIVKAPQNGGREITGEDGYAFFRRMGQLRMTDVYVDPDSLADPYWIPGFAGASVLPREGHVVPLQFPVHMGGEMDGTVYVRGADGQATPLRSVRLGLYDKDGKKVFNTASESDGFYLMSKIPPGDYKLVVDEAHLPKGVSRPLPQDVRIGYEGTTIYANNIYLEEGRPDVPVTMLTNANIYGDAAEQYAGRSYVLNLGTFKSRLSMGLAWFKVRVRNGGLLQGADLLQKPSESLPEENGEYILRLSIQDTDLQGAYRKCAVISGGGDFCAVEVLPQKNEEKVAAK